MVMGTWEDDCDEGKDRGRKTVCQVRTESERECDSEWVPYVVSRRLTLFVVVVVPDTF
jgi:hypothetical protein